MSNQLGPASIERRGSAHSDPAWWHPHVVGALQIRKNGASEAEIVRVCKQLARLADTAALAQTHWSAAAIQEPQSAFHDALAVCSGT